jgi:hypothetical protein
MSRKNPVTPPGIIPGTVRLVTQRLNHYATPGPKYISSLEDNIETDLKEILWESVERMVQEYIPAFGRSE